MVNQFDGADISFPNIGIRIERLPTVAVRILGVDIYWYAVIMTAAILCAWLLARYRAKQTGQRPEIYDYTLALGVVLAIMGGRIYYIVFSGLPVRELFAFRSGGTAFYGCLLGMFLTCYISAKWQKTSPLVLLDTCMPSITLGQVIGRWGNFVNREAFGRYTNSLLAMRMRVDQVRGVMVGAGQGDYIQAHPTFLYESALNLVFLVLLIKVIRPKVKFTGEMICWYALGYGIIRGFVEGLRVDQLLLFTTGLPVSQVVAFTSAYVAAVVLAYKRGVLKRFIGGIFKG